MLVSLRAVRTSEHDQLPRHPLVNHRHHDACRLSRAHLLHADAGLLWRRSRPLLLRQKRLWTSRSTRMPAPSACLLAPVRPHRLRVRRKSIEHRRRHSESSAHCSFCVSSLQIAPQGSTGPEYSRMLQLPLRPWCSDDGPSIVALPSNTGPRRAAAVAARGNAVELKDRTIQLQAIRQSTVHPWFCASKWSNDYPVFYAAPGLSITLRRRRVNQNGWLARLPT